MNELVEQKAALMDRIHTACLTVSTFDRAGPRGFFSTWPAYKLDWYDIEEFGAVRMPEAVVKRLIAPPRFYPTAKQIDDALPALQLLDGGADRRQRKIIRLRAFQLWYGEHVDADDEEFAHWRGGWRAIGALAGCSHTSARTLHAQAMSYAFERFLERALSCSSALSKSLA